jgi:hypothetical protein
MNARLLLAAGLAAALTLSSGCASHHHGGHHRTHQGTPEGERWLQHDVYFELSDATPEAVDRLEADCWEKLADLPGIRYFATGRPAPELDREFNDRDFDLVLHVVFESMEAHDAYQVSEPHQELLARHGASFSRVRVFDAWGQARSRSGRR